MLSLSSATAEWDISGAREPEELARLALQEELPYHRHLHLVYRVIGDGRATVELPDLPCLRDGEGRIDAAAIFGAADVTNGLAYLGALGSDAYTTGLVVQEARCGWRAHGPGPVLLTAALPMRGEELLARFAVERRFRMRATVSVATGAGEDCGTVELDYYVRRMITGRRLQF